MKDYSDEILWNFCLEGDKNAFRELYIRFYPLLLNYGLKITHDKELIEDVIQNLFIKVISNHNNLSPSKYVKGYLLLSFKNKLFDSLKLKNDSIMEYDFEISDIDRCVDDEPENDKINTLLKAFGKLNSNQKEILYLHYVCKMKHEEIAEMMKINKQSSKNLLSRSLSNLRKLFFSDLK